MTQVIRLCCKLGTNNVYLANALIAEKNHIIVIP